MQVREFQERRVLTVFVVAFQRISDATGSFWGQAELAKLQSNFAIDVVVFPRIVRNMKLVLANAKDAKGIMRMSVIILKWTMTKK